VHRKKEKETKSLGELNQGLTDCTVLGSVYKRMQKKTDVGCQEEVIF